MRSSRDEYGSEEPTATECGHVFAEDGTSSCRGVVDRKLTSYMFSTISKELENVMDAVQVQVRTSKNRANSRIEIEQQYRSTMSQQANCCKLLQILHAYVTGKILLRFIILRSMTRRYGRKARETWSRR